jgi:hypothetical protein
MQRLLFEVLVWQKGYIELTDKGTFGRKTIHTRCNIFHTVATLRPPIPGLKPKETAAGLFDTKARGLNLRVTSKGVKARGRSCSHRPRDGKGAGLSVGTYPATGLATARTLAVEARRRALGSPMTVAMLAQSYSTDGKEGDKHGKRE